MNTPSVVSKAAKSRIQITPLDHIVTLSDKSKWRLYHAVNGNFDAMMTAIRSLGFTRSDWEQDDSLRAELREHAIRIHARSVRYYYVCLGPSRTLYNETVLRYRVMAARGSQNMALETKTSIGRSLNPSKTQTIRGIHFFLRVKSK